jgi:hypothetical protein
MGDLGAKFRDEENLISPEIDNGYQ